MVQRAGLGLPSAAEDKIRARISPTCASPARGHGSEGRGLLLPPYMETGVIRGWFGPAWSPTMRQPGHRADSAAAFGAAALVWEGLLFLENSSAGDSRNPHSNQPSSGVALRCCGRGSARAAETFHLITRVGATMRQRPPSTRLQGGWDTLCSQPAPPAWGGGCCPRTAISQHLQGGLCRCRDNSAAGRLLGATRGGPLLRAKPAAGKRGH